VQFAHVTSPLASRTSLAQFFQVSWLGVRVEFFQVVLREDFSANFGVFLQGEERC
jgi:hypothetical protein